MNEGEQDHTLLILLSRSYLLSLLLVVLCLCCSFSSCSSSSSSSSTRVAGTVALQVIQRNGASQTLIFFLSRLLSYSLSLPSIIILCNNKHTPFPFYITIHPSIPHYDSLRDNVCIITTLIYVRQLEEFK